MEEELTLYLEVENKVPWGALMELDRLQKRMRKVQRKRLPTPAEVREWSEILEGFLLTHASAKADQLKKLDLYQLADAAAKVLKALSEAQRAKAHKAMGALWGRS